MGALIIAVDGPAAAGKGTLSRRLAAEYELAHLDTGALYRATARDVLAAGVDPSDGEAAAALATKLDPTTLTDPALRSEAVGRTASIVSAHPAVRAALLEYQRNFAYHPPDGMVGAGARRPRHRHGGLPAGDGEAVRHRLARGALVPSAARTRGGRRPGRCGGGPCDMQARDERDSRRSASPLKPATDAVVLDTSGLDADEAFGAAVSIVRARIRSFSGSQA